MHVHPHGISHFHTHTHLHTRSPRCFPDPAFNDSDITAGRSDLQRQAHRLRRHNYPTGPAVCTKIESHQWSRWMTTVHRSVIIVTHATMTGYTAQRKTRARSARPGGPGWWHSPRALKTKPRAWKTKPGTDDPPRASLAAG